MFRMIESNMIITDTFISHQIPNPNIDPDSETLGITESQFEELTSSTSFGDIDDEEDEYIPLPVSSTCMPEGRLGRKRKLPGYLEDYYTT